MNEKFKLGLLVIFILVVFTIVISFVSATYFNDWPSWGYNCHTDGSGTCYHPHTSTSPSGNQDVCCTDKGTSYCWGWYGYSSAPSSDSCLIPAQFYKYKYNCLDDVITSQSGWEDCTGCNATYNCVGKTCGDDGCGGSCGSCTSGNYCVEASQTCSDLPTCKKTSGTYGYINQLSTEDIWSDCSSGYNACTNICVKYGPDGLCDGAGACDTNDLQANVAAGKYCSSGSEVSGQCSGTDHCYGDDRYSGYDCDGSGNCDVHDTDIGCCQHTDCASDYFCQTDYSCDPLSTCGERTGTDYGQDAQENGEDSQNDCTASWNACSSICVKQGPDGACTGGSYACDTDDATQNVAAGYYCSSGSEIAGQCSGTDHCSGDDRYSGYDCDGSGNCDVDDTDIGCCDHTDCTSAGDDFCQYYNSGDEGAVASPSDDGDVESGYVQLADQYVCAPAKYLDRGTEAISTDLGALNTYYGRTQTYTGDADWWQFLGDGMVTAETTITTSDTDLCFVYNYDPCSLSATSDVVARNPAGTRYDLGDIKQGLSIIVGCSSNWIWIDLGSYIGGTNGIFQLAYYAGNSDYTREWQFGWTTTEVGATDGSGSSWCCDDSTDCVDDAPTQGNRVSGDPDTTNSGCYATSTFRNTGGGDGADTEECRSGTWYAQDADQTACQNAGNEWSIGGETAQTSCCEDDTSENNIDSSYHASIENAPAASDGCCIASTDCVSGSSCTDTASTSDVDGTGDVDLCTSGTWYDCSTTAHCDPAGEFAEGESNNACTGATDCDEACTSSDCIYTRKDGWGDCDANGGCSNNVCVQDTNFATTFVGTGMCDASTGAVCTGGASDSYDVCISGTQCLIDHDYDDAMADCAGSNCLVASGATADLDNDGDDDYCNAGTWIDCNTNSECDAGSGYFCSGNDCTISCTANADCLSGWYCSEAGTCATQKSQGGTCDFAITETDSTTESNGVCSSGYCRDDYDSGNVDGNCDSGDQCWCITASTSCAHNAAAYVTSSTPACSDTGVSNEDGIQWLCTSGDWGTNNCADGQYCNSGTCTDCTSGNCITYLSCRDGTNGGCCDVSSECTSGNYCRASDYTCQDLPLCQEANAGTEYNVQEDNEDLWNDCSTGWNTCTGSGSPYKCSRTGPDGLCDGAGACDTNDASGSITSGSVCTGSGTETAGSTTYYSSTDSADRCSAPSTPDSGLGDPTYDVFACDGAGGTGGPDVGDKTSACTGCCYDAGASASCITAPDYGTYNYYDFGVGDGTTDYCVADANLDDCFDENDCNSASGYYCNSGSCVISCTQNSDCLTNWYCTSGSVCETLLADGSTCVGVTAIASSTERAGACTSGYCDDDGEGTADDNWCYTPSSTLYDGQEATKCEYDTGAAVDIFADEQAVLYTYDNTGSASTYYGCPAYSSCKVSSSPACQAYDGDGTSGICGSFGTWTTITSGDLETDSNNCADGVSCGDGTASNGFCCGDDVNENYQSATYDAGTMDAAADGTNACCNAATDCIDAATCYTTTDVSNDADSDGDNDYCNSGTWDDCNTDNECAIGYYCNSDDCAADIITVTYQGQTPADNSENTDNSVTINVTVSSTGSNVDACTLDWNGINESMTEVGSGTSISCYKTKSGLSDGTTYTFNVFANNTNGGVDSESERSFTENSAPVISSLRINPTTAYTNNNLQGYCNATDGDGDKLIYYYKWWNETSEYTSGTNNNGTNNFTEGQEILINTLSSSITTEGENWTLECRAFDGMENSSWLNSSTVTIESGIPTISLTSPDNNTAITQSNNRTPTFTWSANDPNSDPLNYTIWISENNDFSTTAIKTIITSEDQNYTAGSELDLDTTYWWTVEAYDGTTRINATKFNFTIESYTAITLTTDGVSFGSLATGTSADTETDASPMIVENIGNIFVNLSIYANTTLFTTVDLNTNYFQYKADVSEAGAYDAGTSQTTWTNMTDATTNLLKEFNYSAAADSAQIDINISIPSKEPPGALSSQIIVTTG